MSKVLVILSTGFEEIETVSIVDILRRANVDVTISTINDLLTIGANKITIQADKKLEDLDDIGIYDMVVLPGGAQNCQNLANNNLVKSILKTMKETQKYVTAICASPYVLHEAKVLNKEYTCYPSFEEKIDSATFSDKSDVIIDEKVITSRGPATAMQFALELVKTLEGEEKYTKIKNGLLVSHF